MLTEPKGQKRPADAIGNAVTIMRIATGEHEEDFGPKKPETAGTPSKSARMCTEPGDAYRAVDLG